MNIIIERGKVIEFKDLPSYSIALDGYVSSGPEYDSINHKFNFDHHNGCLRFCTLSTCQQAYFSILAGLEPENYTLYANDIDSDVVLAIWCLSNPDRCREPLVKKLVDAVGTGDMFAGAISTNGMTKTVEWIAGPETDSKRNDDYSKLSDDGLYSIMEAVLHRIDQYVDGEASVEITKQHKHGEYKILRNENGWVMVESKDPHVYQQLYQAGFDRIVLVRKQKDGSNAISLAKRSDFISSFPLSKFYEELNKLEIGWGGSNLCGGAPRNHDGSRSKLQLDKIVEVIDGIIASL